MEPKKQPVLALFYCQGVPGSRENDRQDLEKKYGGRIRLFSLPCSGRLEPVHLMRALEEFADAAYIVTCPEGLCRNFEGNKRAFKRVERTREIISQLGLEKERIGIVIGHKDKARSLAEIASDLFGRIDSLGPSPVLTGTGAER